MKRIALVFLIAILLPSALLAVLAVRSVRDQEVIVNSQRILAQQTACEARAAEINLFFDDVRIFYGRLVDDFVKAYPVTESVTFNEHVRSGWTQAAVGAVVTDSGSIISPVPKSGLETQTFLENHSDFLTNRRVVEIYEAPRLLNSQIKVVSENYSAAPKAEAGIEKELDEFGDLENPEEVKAERKMSSSMKVGVSQNRLQEFRFEKQGGRVTAPADGAAQGVAAVDRLVSRAGAPGPADPASVRASQMPQAVLDLDEEVAEGVALQSDALEMAQSPAPLGRTVAPVEYGSYATDQGINRQTQQELAQANYSQLSRERVLFNDLAETEREGAISRIIDGELHVLLWKRPEAQPDRIFWVEMDLIEIRKDLEELFSESVTKIASIATQPEMSLALLDSKGELVTQTVKGFATDWTRPFVAAEVGQILPRWEVAAYFINPDAISQSAKTVRLLLGWLVGLSLTAVAAGSYLIFRSVNYEMRLAARKTDFVSNVSHELKTPLTSIRMFSDLLAKSERPDTEKTKQYSEVISKESARLGRLIHRLLDFSRMERGELKLAQDSVDLSVVIPQTVDQVRPQIEGGGLQLRVAGQSASQSTVSGDADAISQVLLNLLSNAEKYGAEGGEIEVDLEEVPGEVIVSVHDRGPGIPRGLQRKIFEKFYRVDESIDSGIEGSGIGLALSHQIMEKMGGALKYQSRSGGGSSFSMHFPRAKS